MAEKNLKEAFRQFLVNKNNQDDFFRAQIRVAWPKLFGKNIAQHTRLLEVKNRKLYVYTNTSSVRNQLMMVREGIRKRINEALGEEYLEEVIPK